jgi:hypothetical protein
MVITGDFVPTARKFLRGTAKQALHASKLRPMASTNFSVEPRMGGFVVGGRQQVIDELAKYARVGLQEAVFRCNNLASDAEPEYLAAEIMRSARDI